MPVECVPSNLESDLRCAVCGQGFLLFCHRVTQRQRTELCSLVQTSLRRHHHDANGNDHPHDGFLVEFASETLIPVYA